MLAIPSRAFPAEIVEAMPTHRNSELHLPPPHLRAMEALARLTDEQYETLRAALRDSPVASFPDVVAYLSERSQDLPVDPRETLEMLMGAGSIPFWQGITVDEVTTSVSGTTSLDLDDVERDLLAERLAGLLSAPPVKALSKAVDVLTEHQRLFLDARIVTDVRPLFTDEEPLSAIATVVVHNLRITFQEDGRRREFHVGLDRHDIAILRKAADRADDKAEAIENMLTTTDVKIIGFEGEQ